MENMNRRQLMQRAFRAGMATWTVSQASSVDPVLALDAARNGAQDRIKGAHLGQLPLK